MDNYFTVCLPTLEMKTFEQQTCSKKLDTQMLYHWEQVAAKRKERDHFEQHTSSKKIPIELWQWLL